MIKRLFVTVILMATVTTVIYAAAEDYVILQNIVSYKLFTGIAGRTFSGSPKQYSQSSTSGVVQGAGHFSENEVSYDASYTELNGKWPFVKVEVTKHAGSESDKWLLHEAESKYRSTSKLGTLIGGAEIRDFNGNKVFNWISYSWISNNVVVYVNWSPKPDVNNVEPLEIIQAYLQKFPSTIPASLVLDKAHDVQWIKDEMDRRLWLCDKWFMQLQLKKVEEKQVYQESVKSMNVFLDYRGKYYGIKAADEKNLLAGYLNANNGTGIKAKLKEYKDWWNVHKTDAISL